MEESKGRARENGASESVVEQSVSNSKAVQEVSSSSSNSISSPHEGISVVNYSENTENGNGDIAEQNISLTENAGCKSDEALNGDVSMKGNESAHRELQSDTNSMTIVVDSEQNGSPQGQNKEGNLDMKSDGSENGSNVIKNLSPKKARKRAIFVSYSPGASLREKMFICYTVRELKNIGFCDDVWFDRDEMLVGSPNCFQQRLEIAEKCRAALMFVSESYFGSRLCKHEGTILLGRDKPSCDNSQGVEKSVKLFCVRCDNFHLPPEYRHLQDRMVNVSSSGMKIASIAEKSSRVVASFSEAMEAYAPLFGLRAASPPREPETPKEFMKKQISTWSVFDVQEWLISLKVHPRFTLSFEENQIDGFLLLTMSEGSMEEVLGVDSRVVRRKILQQIKSVLEKESQMKKNWFMKLRKVKGKSDSVYIIFDPNDTRLVQDLKRDLVKKNIQVYHHNRLGQSKDEFLQLNGPHMAVCLYVIVVMTAASAQSLFVYNEILLADWLEKSIVVLMFNNSWLSTRTCVQSILGGCASVDFENTLYPESLDVLMYHIKPLRHMPAVILEQDFLSRMVDGLKPLKVLVSFDAGQAQGKQESPLPKIFFSYHWDVQTRVQLLVQHLEKNNFECWTDARAVAKQPSFSVNSVPPKSHDSLQSQIRRNMKAAKAVVCCVSQKYICSNNCAKDLALAELLGKPIIPLLFEWISWPPESGAVKARKILAPHTCIDMSNEKLYKKNLHYVVAYLKKLPSNSHDMQQYSSTGNSPP